MSSTPRHRLVLYASIGLVIAAVLATLGFYAVTALLEGARRRDAWVQACTDAGGWVHWSEPPMCIVGGRITQVGDRG